MTMNQPFISKNQRDYRFISGLQLLPYPGVAPQGSQSGDAAQQPLELTALCAA